MWVFMGAWIAQRARLLFKERKEGRIDAHRGARILPQTLGRPGRVVAWATRRRWRLSRG